MGKGLVVIILGLFLSALLRLESKLIVAAQNDDDNTSAHL
jgi:hypothetical protein